VALASCTVLFPGPIRLEAPWGRAWPAASVPSAQHVLAPSCGVLDWQEGILQEFMDGNCVGNRPGSSYNGREFRSQYNNHNLLNVNSVPRSGPHTELPRNVPCSDSICRETQRLGEDKQLIPGHSGYERQCWDLVRRLSGPVLMLLPPFRVALQGWVPTQTRVRHPLWSPLKTEQVPCLSQSSNV
jgi:hypothetical protein